MRLCLLLAVHRCSPHQTGVAPCTHTTLARRAKCVSANRTYRYRTIAAFVACIHAFHWTYTLRIAQRQVGCRLRASHCLSVTPVYLHRLWNRRNRAGCWTSRKRSGEHDTSRWGKAVRNGTRLVCSVNACFLPLPVCIRATWPTCMFTTMLCASPLARSRSSTPSCALLVAFLHACMHTQNICRCHMHTRTHAYTETVTLVDVQAPSSQSY